MRTLTEQIIYDVEKLAYDKTIAESERNWGHDFIDAVDELKESFKELAHRGGQHWDYYTGALSDDWERFKEDINESLDTTEGGQIIKAPYNVIMGRPTFNNIKKPVFNNQIFETLKNNQEQTKQTPNLENSDIKDTVQNPSLYEDNTSYDPVVKRRRKKLILGPNNISSI